VSNEAAFSAVTLLVAACEQATQELGALETRPSRLLEWLAKTQAEAIDVARQLAPASDPPPES